jgi:phage baseplate assembly protein W
MAFEVKKINPLDLNPNTGVGVELNYASPGVFTTTYTTAEATKNNLINYLLTGQGERYLNPTFGLGLQSFIFEQLNANTEVAIEQIIQTQIQELFPAIQVDTLTITQEQDTGQLNINLTFTIGQEADSINITIG